MMSEDIRLIVTMLGSGFMAYAGVRVAIAEIRTNHTALDKRVDANHAVTDKRLEKAEDRLDRLEARYFKAD